MTGALPARRTPGRPERGAAGLAPAVPAGAMTRREAPGLLAIDGALLISPQMAALVATALRRLVRLTERVDGGQVSSQVLVVLGQCERVAASLTSTDVDVSTSVVDVGRDAASDHELLDTTAAAHLLGCSPGNVRDLARRGAIPSRRIGRRWLLDRQDVLDEAHARRERRSSH